MVAKDQLAPFINDGYQNAPNQSHIFTDKVEHLCLFHKGLKYEQIWEFPIV